MASDRKLFVARRYAEPEYGQSEHEWTKYFLVSPMETIETVRDLINERYGEDRYYSMDRIQIRTYIDEVTFEEL